MRWEARTNLGTLATYWHARLNRVAGASAAAVDLATTLPIARLAGTLQRQ